MELELSLGDASSKPFAFMEKAQRPQVNNNKRSPFSMSLGLCSIENRRQEEQQKLHHVEDDDYEENEGGNARKGDAPHLQLDLLPLARLLPRNQTGSSEETAAFDVNRTVGEEAEEAVVAAAESSPNSAASSFQMDFCIYRGGSAGTKRDSESGEAERTSSRASDEDDNGLTRKKLRLSKEQSAFLEESFKEHNTLNPKQKIALAKRLNLRPRQVEVWFQNRRARTKLKQTEVDCEYLKRCCETLTEENRRLRKELQELRALKNSNPFYMQLPATTLTMCPSCERVASAATATATTVAGADPATARSRLYPFSNPASS